MLRYLMEDLNGDSSTSSSGSEDEQTPKNKRYHWLFWYLRIKNQFDNYFDPYN